MSSSPSYRAEGEQVWVASAAESDREPYRRALEQSRERVARWNPVDVEGFGLLLSGQGRAQQSLMIHAREVVGDHDLVGKVNVTNIVRGRASAATLGYDAFDPYAEQGLFAEGLRLAVDVGFASEPGGLGLHRIEVNVQPGNTRSAGVVRRAGFSHEGFSPDYLLLPDGTGDERWRHHDRYAILRSEWPAQPYQSRPARRTVVLVHGAHGTHGTDGDHSTSGDTLSQTAVRLADELVLPVLDAATIGWDAVWAVLAASPAGAVIAETNRGPQQPELDDALRAARCDPERMLRVVVDTAPDDADIARLAVDARAASLG